MFFVHYLQILKYLIIDCVVTDSTLVRCFPIANNELDVEDQTNDADNTEERGELLRIHRDAEELVAVVRNVVYRNGHKTSG